MKRQFKILLTATMQKTFAVEAADEDEARELGVDDGLRGEMDSMASEWLGGDDKKKGFCPVHIGCFVIS